jgi:hypothetical protein
LRGKTLAWKARNRVWLPREGIQLARTGRAGETEAKCAVIFLCRGIGKCPKFPALAATFTVVEMGENRAQELPIELERINCS